MMYNVSSVIPPIRGNSNHLQSRASRSNRTVILSFIPGKCRDLTWYLNKPYRVEEEKVHCERNTGQELAIVTDLANVSSWKEYSRLGYDLHSMNASLIFGEEWEEAKEEGCRFYKDEARKKCKCSGHMQMRDKSKAATFGSIYGIAGPGLAAQLKCSIKEANFILERFFTVVPEVRIMMDKFGSFGLRNGYIIEPVFGRIRYFDQWKLAVDKEAAGVARASFNSPIQSAGSSILKIAFVLMRRQIKRENLERLIKLLLPYHDETLAQSKNEEEIIKKAKQIVEHCMQFASKVAGFNIGAGAAHGMSWYDAH